MTTKQTEYVRQWYKNHPGYEDQKREARNADAQAWKLEQIFKKGDKCGMCGIHYNGYNAAIFEFHHRDPSEKEGRFNTRSKKGRDVATEEVEKCDLLCANCHKLIHKPEF